MTNETNKLYNWAKIPKYIEWEKNKRTIYYYAPLLIKNEHDGHPDAYIAMYARMYFRTTGLSFRNNDFFFRVEGSSFDEVLKQFQERLDSLQEDGLIKGRTICIEKVQAKHKELINKDLYFKFRTLYYKNKSNND